MKKIYLALLLAVLTTFGFLSASHASTYNSGEFIFRMDGNDSNASEAIIENEIKTWFSAIKGIDREVNLDFYSKIDAPYSSSNFMTITYDNQNLSGTWSTQEPIEFYSVKSATEFAFYWVDGGDTSGFWSTEDLLTPNDKNTPEISHISSWNPLESPPPTQSHSPEPATMFLFGLGLLGLAGVSRKK